MRQPAEEWPIERGRVRFRAPLRDLFNGRGDGDVASLRGRIVELEARLAAAHAGAVGHVLLVGAPDGYQLVDSDEEPPPVGQLMILDGRTYRVVGTRRSPLPGDPRPCVLVEREMAAES